MKNMSNRGKLLIAFALIVVIAVAAIFAGNLNRKDEGPAPLTYPIGVTLSLRLNEQGVNDLLPRNADLADESFRKTLSAVSALVNNATVRMTLDSGVFRTDLRLKDQDILYFAMKMAQDAIRIKTDILPDDAVIVMTAEDLAAAGSMPAFPEVTAEDMKAAREAMEEFAKSLRIHLKEKCGDEEKGSWDFEGKVFTSRRPVSLTMKELMVLILNDYRDMLQSEKLAAYYTKADISPAEEMGRYIEAIESIPDDQLPAMTMYLSESGDDIYSAIDLDSKTDTAHIDCGIVGSNIAAHGTVTGSANAKIDLKADARGYNYDFTASIDAPSGSSASGERMTVDLKAAGTTEKTGEGKGSVSVSVSGSELFAADYTIGKGESVSVDFDAENQRVITLDTLNNLNRTAEGRQLSQELTSGALRIFQRISAAMPDEVNQLITLMTILN